MFHGHKYESPMKWAVFEYLERKRLVAMGFRFDITDMPTHRIDALLTVDAKWNELTEKKKQAKAKMPRKR